MTNRYICIDGIDDVHVHVTIWEIPTYACAHKHVYTHSVCERERVCVCMCAREGKTPLHEMLQPLLLYKCREGSQTVALVFS